jgi:actin-related protein
LSDGEEGPKRERTICGKYRSVLPGLSQVVFGDSAYNMRQIVSPTFPIRDGLIQADKSEELAIFLKFILSRSYCSEEDVVHLVMTKPINFTFEHYEKLLDIAFKQLKVASVVPVFSALSAFHSLPSNNGIWVDFGLNATRIVAISDGHINIGTYSEFAVGGDHISQYLAKLLAADGWSIAGSQSAFEQIDSMKEATCYVALDYRAEVTLAESNPEQMIGSWQNGENQVLFPGSPRFMAPELIFQPNLDLSFQTGLIEHITDAIAQFPSSKPSLPVLLSGGISKMKNIVERIQIDLDRAIGNNKAVVSASEMACWFGALALAKDDQLRSRLAISRSQYEEDRDKAVNTVHYSIQS